MLLVAVWLHSIAFSVAHNLEPLAISLLLLLCCCFVLSNRLNLRACLCIAAAS